MIGYYNGTWPVPDGTEYFYMQCSVFANLRLFAYPNSFADRQISYPARKLPFPQFLADIHRYF
jgi:hypothetical protein